MKLGKNKDLEKLNKLIKRNINELKNLTDEIKEEIKKNNKEKSSDKHES